MKPVAIIGSVLIVLGLAALAYQGFTYTTRQTVVDFPATADREKTVALPPVFGIVAVAGGAALLVGEFLHRPAVAVCLAMGPAPSPAPSSILERRL